MEAAVQPRPGSEFDSFHFEGLWSIMLIGPPRILMERHRALNLNPDAGRKQVKRIPVAGGVRTMTRIHCQEFIGSLGLPVQCPRETFRSGLHFAVFRSLIDIHRRSCHRIFITIWDFTGRRDSSGNQRESATLFPQGRPFIPAGPSFYSRRAGAAAPGGICSCRPGPPLAGELENLRLSRCAHRCVPV